MDKTWLNLGKPENRARLSWIGGGIAVVVAGAWGVVTYVWPAHDGPGGTNCAQNASVASSGDVSHVTINASGATQQATGSTGCANPAAAKP